MATHVQSLIWDHFVAGLDAAADARMRAHLRDCHACREEYDRIAVVLRETAAAEPPRAESEHLWQRIDATLEAGPQGAAADTRPRAKRPVWRLVGVFATLILVVGALILAERLQRPQPRLRGSTTAAPLVDFEVFAIRPKAGGYELPRRVADGGVLSLEDLIQLRYRSRHSTPRYLYLFAFDSGGRVLDYFPRPGEDRSLRIDPAPTPKAIGRSIRLKVRHRPGPLTIFALGSPQPLQRTEVAAAIASARADRESREKPATIELELDLGADVEVTRQRFTIVP